MKVIEMVKKFRMCSNSEIFIQSGATGDLTELKRSDLIELTPDFVMQMRINSFDVIDNVLTIHVDPR